MTTNADGSVTITVPHVTAVTLTPNPATINAKVAAAVTITESTQTLYPEYKYCGVARCGGGA